MRASPPPKPTATLMIDSKKPPAPSALVEIQPMAVSIPELAIAPGVLGVQYGLAARTGEDVKKINKIRADRVKRRFMG